MKIITIIGARPQFVKAAMVSRAILKHNNGNQTPIEERILHTGQHYDENMSQIFFSGMGIPQPTWQLQCGQYSYETMTGQMDRDRANPVGGKAGLCSRLRRH